MPELDKKSLSERDICTQLITPALVAAGWDLQAQVREEVSFTKGGVASTLVSVPSLAEQHRIVAKVEQLMALVDALEQQLAASAWPPKNSSPPSWPNS